MATLWWYFGLRGRLRRGEAGEALAKGRLAGVDSLAGAGITPATPRRKPTREGMARVPAQDGSAAETVDRLRREQFPVTGEKVWLNTATYGPLPVSNVAAQRELLEGMMHGAGAPGLGHWWEGAAEVREKVGTFIGCDAGDVALLRSTGEGIGLVSQGLDWRPGGRSGRLRPGIPQRRVPVPRAGVAGRAGPVR